MNFLGHLALAAPHKALMVGGFLGDFVKGDLNSTSLANQYPENIKSGIRLHRRIDARSDSHSSIAKLKAELPKTWARYAGILADLYCDHLIANPNHNLLDKPISDFANQSYLILQQEKAHFNERAERVFTLMHQGRWLEKYADIDFTAASLERIGMRFNFANPLFESAAIIKRYKNTLDQCCQSLYADMQKVVAEWQAEQIQQKPI